MKQASPGDKRGLPETLEEAMACQNGPIAKFYMTKYAPKDLDKSNWRNLNCDQIRELISLHLGV